jgi:hypothetical protein
VIAKPYILIAASLLFWPASTQSRAAEMCPASPDGDQQGYLIEIGLCTADSPRCRSRGAPLYKARRPENAETETLSIPDIPDGYVITGGELYSSVYELATRGFKNVRFAGHGDASDYCSRHRLLEMRAEWTGDDASDNFKIDACVRFAKWAGATPAEPCPPPAP